MSKTKRSKVMHCLSASGLYLKAAGVYRNILCAPTRQPSIFNVYLGTGTDYDYIESNVEG